MCSLLNILFQYITLIQKCNFWVPNFSCWFNVQNALSSPWRHLFGGHCTGDDGWGSFFYAWYEILTHSTHIWTAQKERSCPCDLISTAYIRGLCLCGSVLDLLKKDYEWFSICGFICFIMDGFNALSINTFVNNVSLHTSMLNVNFN